MVAEWMKYQPLPVCGIEYRNPGGSSNVALLFVCISLAYVLPINVVFTVNSVIRVVLVVVIKEIVSIVVDVECKAATNIKMKKKHSVCLRKSRMKSETG